MREKHPDAEAQCVYCMSGQAHPRLARGESYSCGYKPFRCEVCNYSTTTKGNLSIHFQSDKHMNNLYELQKGAAVGSILASLGQCAQGAQAGAGPLPAPAAAGRVPPARRPPPRPSRPPPRRRRPRPSPSAASNPKAKLEGLDAPSELAASSSSDASLEPLASLKQEPVRRSVSCVPNGSPSLASSHTSAAATSKSLWRCEYCNYETSVARNLRIHMTSEKHLHNEKLAQQRQQLLASPAAAAAGPPDAARQQPGSSSSPAAAAPAPLMPDVLKQMLAQMLPNMPLLPPALQSAFGRLDNNAALAASLHSMLAAHAHASSCGGGGGGGGESTSIGGAQEALASAAEDEEAESGRECCSDHLFQCLVCQRFGCDSLELLEAHVSRDRSKLADCSDAMRALHARLGVTGTQVPAPAAAGGDAAARTLQVCRLCPYQTAIAANFQMHLKTEKHMQRLAHLNHMAEAIVADDADEEAIARVEQRVEQLLRGGGGSGGAGPGAGDLAAGRVTQVQCAACDLVASSISKLHAHCCTREHTLLAELHAQLVRETQALVDAPATLSCALCDTYSHWHSAGSCVRFLRHAHAVHWSQLAAAAQLQEAEPLRLEQWVSLECGKYSN